MSITSGLTRSVLAWLLAGTVFVGGCRDWDPAESFFKTGWSRFLDASKPIRTPEGSPVNTILPSVGLADQTEERLPNSTLPAEEDYIYDDKDYVIGPSDVVSIGIMDLFVEGTESLLQREVSATGYVDLPLLEDRIKAEGLNKEELKEAVKEAYSPEVILDPVISVRVLGRRQSKFSLLGQGSQGTYILARPDTRLLEALALSGGIPQTTIRYIYVMRHKRPMSRSQAEARIQERATTAPAVETRPAVTTRPATAQSVPADKAVKVPTTALEAALQELESAMPKSKSTTKPAEPETLPAPSVMMHPSETSGQGSPGANSRRRGVRFKWTYKGNKWVKVPLVAATPRVESTRQPAPAEDVQSASAARPRAVTAALAAQPKPASTPVATASVPDMRSTAAEIAPSQATAPRQTRPAVSRFAAREVEDPFGWQKVTKSDQVRIVAINLDKLKQGDPRMNIVIRDNDIIYVPPVRVGEFYVMGEVDRPGVYSLTGRRVTIRQALAAAGNLGSGAWPSNSYLVRRIGQNQEQVIAVDIEKIFRGQEPDIFLKPEDVIAVGTHVAVPFMAGLRGLVPTFNIGFSYSRSFAPTLLGFNQGRAEESRHSDRFKRW